MSADLDDVFVELPCGFDGRELISIRVGEIASYYSYTRSSYTFEDWTKVTLKSGVQHDCKIRKSDLEAKFKQAQQRLLDARKGVER